MIGRAGNARNRPEARPDGHRPAKRAGGADVGLGCGMPAWRCCPVPASWYPFVGTVHAAQAAMHAGRLEPLVQQCSLLQAQAQTLQSEKVALEEVKAIVPQDEEGNVTSVGSVLHPYARCKPCRNYASGRPESCSNGVRCRFCHFSFHTGGGHRKPHSRTKEKEVYREFVKSVEEQIRTCPDPAHFDVKGLTLPKHVAAVPYVRDRFYVRMSKLVNEVIVERAQT